MNENNTNADQRADTKPLVGVSQCLLGEPVRHNGGHKRNPFLTDALTEYFDFYPLCPEMAIGLGTPRPALRLVQQRTAGHEEAIREESIRLVESKNADVDLTEKMDHWAQQACKQLSQLNGYILQQSSPSCGMERVKVYSTDGHALERNGVGIFARQLMEEFPLLPVEESGRLQDPALRENFILRVYAYHDLRHALLDRPASVGALVRFYSQNKYLVMAHSYSAYRKIGALLSNREQLGAEQLCSRFAELYMGALAKPASRKGHTNVLMHLQGYLKKTLDKSEKSELGKTIRQYQQGQLPLIVPVTLLRQLALRVDNSYLTEQRYWQPYPESLGLRNQI